MFLLGFFQAKKTCSEVKINAILSSFHRIVFLLTKFGHALLEAGKKQPPPSPVLHY